MLLRGWHNIKFLVTFGFGVLILWCVWVVLVFDLRVFWFGVFGFPVGFCCFGLVAFC